MSRSLAGAERYDDVVNNLVGLIDRLTQRFLFGWIGRLFHDFLVNVLKIKIRQETLPHSHPLLVTEMMARLLDPGDRVKLFHGVLQAAVETTRPDALVFKHTQQVVEPRAYLESTKLPPIERPGSLNVRFFNISNAGGEMIMDTRGLEEVGLHDLQCHFRELAPEDFLFATPAGDGLSYLDDLRRISIPKTNGDDASEPGDPGDPEPAETAPRRQALTAAATSSVRLSAPMIQQRSASGPRVRRK